jgi:hypothetical protein
VALFVGTGEVTGRDSAFRPARVAAGVQEGSSALVFREPVMADGVTDPYLVGQEAIAGELHRGKWCVYLHEWLGDEGDLETWQAQVAALAARSGVEVCFVEIPRKDMTLVANVRALPSFDQVKESVAALEHYRDKTAGHRGNGAAVRRRPGE